MTDKTVKNSHTKEEADEINALFCTLRQYFIDNKIKANVGFAASLILTTHIAILSIDTDDKIIEQFKLSLLDARTWQATKQ